MGGDEFFIDLLLYHARLKCYVVVELKGVAFKPEHAGQLNFYLATVDAQIKAPEDKPTIGLLLCKTKNRLVAEYAQFRSRHYVTIFSDNGAVSIPISRLMCR